MKHNDSMGTGFKITLLIVAGVILYPILIPIVSFIVTGISLLFGIVIYGALIIAGIWLIGYLFNQSKDFIGGKESLWDYKSSQEKSDDTKEPEDVT